MKIIRVARDVLLSSLPLAAVIIIVCGFVAPMGDIGQYAKLAVGYICVVMGQTLFLVGLDISILPIGKLVGESLVKLKKAWAVIFFGFVFGLLATVAEPALSVLAKQTNMLMSIVDESVFIWVMSVGIGLFVAFALLRIIKDFNIKIVFAVLYLIVFIGAVFTPDEFIALAFDGSGATTGDVSVPFILALGMGVSAILSKRKTNDDAFGIIGISSVGPILALFIYGIVLKLQSAGVLPQAADYNMGAAESIGAILLSNLTGVALALAPVILLFIPFQLIWIKLPRRELFKILLGALPVFAGLLIFLSGIDYGFAFAGEYIGRAFLDGGRPEWFRWLLLIVGFILGGSITLSEPAVTVLGEQLEEITNGHIRKLTIRLTLAAGIGLASVLSIIKILTQINIMYFLAPLYIIALVMMPAAPTLFVSLAFDSGGVSGGALTSAFLTPLTLGIAQAVADSAGEGAQSILQNGFGMIAFISVTPIIAVEALGIIYSIRLGRLKELESAETESLSALLGDREDEYHSPDEEIERETEEEISEDGADEADSFAEV